MFGIEDGVALLEAGDGRVEDPVPGLYDALQIILGAGGSIARVRSLLTQLAPTSVLDVGGGTGLYAKAVPAGCPYAVVDVDLAKLRRAKRRRPQADAVLADAAGLPFRSGAVDLALFIAVAHHLSDDELDRALAELARVARRAVVLEPLASERLASRFLWRLDRGARPRDLDALTARVGRWFDFDHADVYTTGHRYVLWVGTPRPAPVP